MVVCSSAEELSTVTPPDSSCFCFSLSLVVRSGEMRSQVLPRSRERQSAEAVDSTNAYTTAELEGAIATSTRPHGFGPNPFNSVQLWPPSVDLNSALALGASGPFPPERKVQPLRRKSQSPAKTTSGFFGSIATVLQPVERLGPVKIRSQVLPPSVVL